MTMDRLLRHRIADRGEISREFLDRGLADMAVAVEYVRRLPYGRNTNRGDFRLVLREMKGTCSTKHALLACLAQEQGIPLQLTLGKSGRCSPVTVWMRFRRPTVF